MADGSFMVPLTWAAIVPDPNYFQALNIQYGQNAVTTSSIHSWILGFPGTHSPPSPPNSLSLLQAPGIFLELVDIKNFLEI